MCWGSLSSATAAIVVGAVASTGLVVGVAQPALALAARRVVVGVVVEGLRVGLAVEEPLVLEPFEELPSEGGQRGVTRWGQGGEEGRVGGQGRAPVALPSP